MAFLTELLQDVQDAAKFIFLPKCSKVFSCLSCLVLYYYLNFAVIFLKISKKLQ